MLIQVYAAPVVEYESGHTSPDGYLVAFDLAEGKKFAVQCQGYLVGDRNCHSRLESELEPCYIDDIGFQLLKTSDGVLWSDTIKTHLSFTVEKL